MSYARQALRDLFGQKVAEEKKGSSVAGAPPREGSSFLEATEGAPRFSSSRSPSPGRPPSPGEEPPSEAPALTSS